MKKLLAVLLSIMMLAMPLTSMAENSVWDNAARQETTITIHDLNADLVAALGGLTATAAVEHDCYLLLAALIRPLRGCYSAQFEASPEGLEQRMQRVMALVAERRPAVPDTFAVAARGRPEA